MRHHNRHHNLNPLAAVLEQALKKLDLTEAALEAKVVMLWPQIVGPQMAKASEAQRMQGNTLVVTTRSSAWSQEFSFQKQTIIRKYREKLRQDYVQDLRFVVGTIRGAQPAAEALAPPPEELRRIRLTPGELEHIRKASEGSDPELSQALRRALTREAQLRRWHLEHGAKECSRCGAAYRTSHALCPACRQDDVTRNSP